MPASHDNDDDEGDDNVDDNQECWSILQHRDWSNDKHKSHFEVKINRSIKSSSNVSFKGGVRLGVGTFNLLMSLLPPR